MVCLFYTTADGSIVKNEGEKTLLTSTSDGAQLRKVTFQVANVNKALVFDTSGSYIENRMTNDILWLRERDGVYVVDMMVAPPGRDQKGKPLFWEAANVAGPVSPNEPTKEDGMWDRGRWGARDE